jgi:predicted nuclease of predicted toxin-antitoxin system
MKIFVDENIPLMTVKELLRLGYEVVDIRGTEKEGMADEDIWEMAQKIGCLLVTTDKGFANNRYEKHNGILIIRLKQPNRIKRHHIPSPHAGDGQQPITSPLAGEGGGEG